MLPFIKHQSLDDIDFVKKPSKQIFHDRWKFKVSLPAFDEDILIKVIADSPYVDQGTITTTYTPGQIDASFEVTDYSFGEWLKDSISRKNAWRFTMHACPIYTYNDEMFTERYKNLMAPYIKKEDNKMSKVKTQPPTNYPSFRKFTKVIRSGPVTVAWIEGKKVMVRKTKKDKDDPEKAMLMLFAKSQFSSEAAFHRWFRDQMDMFKEAEDNAKNRS